MLLRTSGFALISLAVVSAPCRAQTATALHGKILAFNGPAPAPTTADRHIAQDIDPARVPFFVFVPSNYTGQQPFGLVVFASPAPNLDNYPGWETALAQHHLLLVSAQYRDPMDEPHRAGLQVLGALEMKAHYPIDPQRVYLAGYGGAAPAANSLAFYAPQLFHGTIQIEGAAFYQTDADIRNATADSARFLTFPPPTSEQIDAAKRDSAFVLVTSPGDSNHQANLAAFGAGLQQHGFREVIDLPANTSNIDADGAYFAQALDYLDAAILPPGASEPAAVPAGLSAASTPAAAAPAWLAKDPRTWPQIHLASNFEIPGNPAGAWRGAGAFLTRLPDGRVIAMTARHVLQDPDLKLDASARSWSLFARKRETNQTPLGPFVFDPAQCDLDAVAALALNQKGPWPAEVLPARTTLLTPGETVYLVGVPNWDSSSRQNVYPGIVQRHEAKSQFTFLIHSQFETLGLSGGPIIDAHGNLTGVYTGHLSHQPTPGQMVLFGIETAAILPYIKPPKANVAR